MLFINIPFENIIDIDCIKLDNIGLDKSYPIILTINDIYHGFNTMWYVKISLSMIIRIYKFIRKPLPSHLLFDQKTMNYINRFGLEDSDNIVHKATRFFDSMNI